jgi:hypothetical protein
VKRHRLSLILPMATLLVAVTSSDSRALGPPVAPVVLDATPHNDPTDKRGGGFLRVTFSPDGDARGDRVHIRVRSTPGDRLVLDSRPATNRTTYETYERKTGSRISTFEWNGLGDNGQSRAPGSYVIKICSATSGLCAVNRVLVHLRIISVFSPQSTGVSVGRSIPVFIQTDRIGPYVLDLAPASNPRAQGFGAKLVERPGRVQYAIPPVSGGLWLLRVTSGRVVTYFPLIVHEATMTRDNPPPGTALVVYPYITWRAYDRADIDRDGEADTWYAHPRRPVIALTGRFEQVRRELSRSGREASPESQQAFAQWLQRHQLTAQHVTDVELGRMPLDALRRYAVIVFPGHSEYYERMTYDRLLAYRNGGGRLYFLSGNSFYGAVAVGKSHIVRLDYRYRTPTRSDFRIAVTGFRSCCWPKSITPRYRLADGIRERLPWLLDGTDLQAGDAFGFAVGEVDTIDRRLSPSGTVTIASATVPRFPVPSRVNPLAWIGTRPFRYEPSGVRPRRIDIGYAATGRGEVFSWGNSGFMVSLTDNSLPAAERAALDQVALNVWRRFTR